MKTKWILWLLCALQIQSCLSQKVIKTQTKPIITIKYITQTRGQFKTITLTPKKTVIKIQTKPQISTLQDTTAFNKILDKVKRINLAALKDLKSPSKNFLFDGAPLAKLIIVKNEEKYETPPFDHGNPNTKIADLVKDILYLSKNIE